MGLTPSWRAVPYEAPLAAPLETARGTIAHRRGWYLAVEAFGETGLGEVVPEPTWGTEPWEEAEAALAALVDRTPLTRPAATLSRGERGASPADSSGREAVPGEVPAFLSQGEGGAGSGGLGCAGPFNLAAVTAWLRASGLTPDQHPAVHAGLELALLDALARSERVPLSVLLAGGRPPLGSLPTAALVGALPPAQAAQAAARAVAAGHRTVKLKLDGREDLARARAVRDALGAQAALRLDANALWPTVEAAAAALDPYADLRPEFLEQPVAGLDALAALQARVSFPLAADEALVHVAACERALALGVRVLVLKPMWRGGLLVARAIAGQARAAGARLVLSSALDRGLGTAGVLHLAAALGEPGCVGLGTVGLFDDGGALEGLQPVAGALAVPGAPGLGLRPRDPLLGGLVEAAA